MYSLIPRDTSGAAVFSYLFLIPTAKCGSVFNTTYWYHTHSPSVWIFVLYLDISYGTVYLHIFPGCDAHHGLLHDRRRLLGAQGPHGSQGPLNMRPCLLPSSDVRQRNNDVIEACGRHKPACWVVIFYGAFPTYPQLYALR